jgi:parallel beta-helix repeat protein
VKNPIWKSAASSRGLAAALVLATMLLMKPASAANDLCGTTILEDLDLDHDLVCSGNGLTIGADGIRIDLNGHTIAGSNTGIGIAVAGRTNVRISGGTIRNFQTGVQVSNSSNVLIAGNYILSNTMDGVDLQAGSVGNTVKENEIRDNFSRGIMLRGGSNDNVVKENVFVANNVGILLFQPVGSIVTENYVSESRTTGIRVRFTATDNVIKENQVVSNPAGIEFLASPAGLPGTGNSVVENALTTNVCGLKGPTVGNTLKENVFQGNVADSCM